MAELGKKQARFPNGSDRNESDWNKQQRSLLPGETCSIFESSSTLDQPAHHIVAVHVDRFLRGK